MHPDLERLIRLQHLDDSAARARQAIAEMPERLAALDARVAEREQAVAAARARLEACQKARRELERQLATAQARLARYKDQLMEVKTNKEYQAMQHEIAAAEREVRATEDRILDRMEEGEDLAKELAREDAALAAERSAVAAEKARLEREQRDLDALVTRTAGERSRLVTEISPDALALFDAVARLRKGVAVVEARDGHCSVCHVRLRPQRFLEVRRNDRIIQCESCQRILYYATSAGPEQGAAVDS